MSLIGCRIKVKICIYLPALVDVNTANRNKMRHNISIAFEVNLHTDVNCSLSV
jgi:hypothetical protein